VNWLSKNPTRQGDQMKFLESLGSHLVEGVEQAAFWIRAFKLEDQIAYVRDKIGEKSERKKATVPIISHYMVDDKLTFFYVLSFDVDALGVQDGIGKIWYCSPNHRDEAIRRRNELANQIMKALEDRAKRLPGETIEMPFELEIESYEPKKESDASPPDQKSR
jgi:hypothetical protein